MKLYQERKVNPLGGCLPILVQMPVFIGIFYVIRKFGGIPNVRPPEYPSFHEGGLLWFQNLSAADPYFILPVISALTMLAATEITAKSVDPQQRWLMRLMPVGITVFLWSFPAGLFVYWITSNLVTLAQNYVIYHHGPGKRPPGSESGGIFSRPSGTGDGDNGARRPANRSPSDGGAEQPESQVGPDDASAQSAKTAKRKRRKKKKK
jgi:YidC/Oxa1 family membrane protein insertase